MGRYLKRIAHGEFIGTVKDACPAASPDEPPGTQTLITAFYDADGQRRFITHEYRRPDGTLGASGIPDPKWLFEDGVIYWCR